MAWPNVGDNGRFRIPGNPAPGTDPEPSVGGGNESATNPMSEGGWPNVGNDGRFAVMGNGAPGSDPCSGPTMTQEHPAFGSGWPNIGLEELGENGEFAVAGNPEPGSEPEIGNADMGDG